MMGNGMGMGWGWIFWLLVLVGAATVALGILVLGLRGGGARLGRVRGAPAALRVLCLAVAALPVATYLAGLVPWERTGSPLTALALAVVGTAGVVTAVALLGPWRRARISATAPPISQASPPSWRSRPVPRSSGSRTAWRMPATISPRASARWSPEPAPG